MRIGQGAIIGMGTIIGPGVYIGSGAFVGAGSLVLKGVPAGSVVYGSPAHVVGLRCDLECKTGLMSDCGPYGGKR